MAGAEAVPGLDHSAGRLRLAGRKLPVGGSALLQLWIGRRPGMVYKAPNLIACPALITKYNCISLLEGQSSSQNASAAQADLYSSTSMLIYLAFLVHLT